MVEKKKFITKRIYMFGLSSLLLLSFVATNDNSSEANIMLTAAAVNTEQQDGVVKQLQQIETEEISKNPLPVIITNAIEPDMLKYKHWTGTYSPDLFVITINGTAIDKGQTYTLDSPDTP